MNFFERRKNDLKNEKKILTSFTGTNKQALEASYLVSLRIAKTGKSHTIGETLVLPAAKDIVKTILGDAAAKKLDIVSLSNDTVSRRIHEMAAQVKEVLVQKVKKSKYFSLQIDESTDLTNFAQLMTYIRYDTAESIEEEFLFCEALSSRTTSDEIFKKINQFVITNGIKWENCVGVCSDGARAMTGQHSGVITKIIQVAPNAKFTHCSIHREALASKAMPSNLKDVLDQAVKVVNFIKSRALNSRMFTILCNEMGSEHNKLLLHSEVRWLSRGKVLSRLFELRSEVQIFLTNSKFELAYCFLDELWLSRLSYLADIFDRLNSLNASLQGSNISPFTVKDKINATIKKLELLVKDVKNKKVNHSHLLKNLLQKTNVVIIRTDIRHPATLFTTSCKFQKIFS